MFTYDTFSFIQVTFLLFLLLGLVSADLRRRPVHATLPVAVRQPAPVH
jgi:hypothetical protein